MAINRLTKNIIIPYRYSKGSIIERQEKSDKLVNNLYKNIKGRFKNDELSLSELNQCVKELLPAKVNLIIKSMEENDDFMAYSDLLYSTKTHKIKYITIELPTKHNKINIKDLPSLMHEFQHFTDQQFHPKYLSRNQSITNKNLSTEKYNNFYENEIYSYEQPESKKDRKYIINRFKQMLNKFLKDFTLEERLEYIQDSRYTLQMEDKAYFTQQKYAKRMNKQHLQTNPEDLLKENDNFMFSEKIAILKELGFDTLYKIRTNHKRELNKLKKAKAKNIENK